MTTSYDIVITNTEQAEEYAANLKLSVGGVLDDAHIEKLVKLL